MILRPAVIGTLWLLTIQASAQSTIVRTATDPEESATVGQRVVLQVDVLGLDTWARLPSLPSVSIPDAIVFTPPNQSVRLTETIGGNNYTGQRYEWWIYPQHPGPMKVSAFPLSIENKTFGGSSETEAINQTTEAVELKVLAIDGTQTHEHVLVTQSLTATQTWSGNTEGLLVGDGITRTISRTVQDAPSLLLTPIRFPSPDGVRVYLKEPQSENTISRGDLTGRRTDEVTYVFENAGTFTIPPITFTWFDAKSNTRQSQKLEGMELTISPEQPDPTAQATPATDSVPRRWFAISASLAGLLLLGIAAVVLRDRLSSWFRQYVVRISRSEAVVFRNFVATARIGNPADTLRDLVHWSDTIQNEDASPQLVTLFSGFGNVDAKHHLDELQQAVDEKCEYFDASDLLRSVRDIRRRVTHRQRAYENNRRSPLPPMRAAE